MGTLVDKIILVILCGGFYLSMEQKEYMVVIFLISIAISGLCSYLEGKIPVFVLFLFYLLLCLYRPDFLYFSSLLSYDIFRYQKWMPLSFVVPLLFSYTQHHWAYNFAILLLICVSFLIWRKTFIFSSLQREHTKLRDSSRELSLELASKNKELLEQQDYEIRFATLRERNRIARDIHDNVGHLLSRAILQTGALSATSEDQQVNEELIQLQETLSDAMNSVRSSVHGLHEESIDLHTELTGLTKQFSFCPVSLDYDAESIEDVGIKYCFIAVVKEGLSNIIKHSNATKVHITVREHPSLYQLIIEDNGRLPPEKDIELLHLGEDHETLIPYKEGQGIGIKGIIDRTEALEGQAHISREEGFQIFLSVPKNRTRTGEIKGG